MTDSETKWKAQFLGFSRAVTACFLSIVVLGNSPVLLNKPVMFAQILYRFVLVMLVLLFCSWLAVVYFIKTVGH